MCGIVGAAARRDIVPVLIEGLRRLEYRGLAHTRWATRGAPAPKNAHSIVSRDEIAVVGFLRGADVDKPRNSPSP